LYTFKYQKEDRMDRSYIAFISYKHTERDAAIAKLIHTLIENYVVPKALRTNGKKLGIVFRDEEELPIASNLSETICSALDATRYLIVICSKESKKSVWVSREVNYFLRNHDADSVFVVLVDGEPDDVFPHELTYVRDKKTGIYQNVEPLALDVRADSTAAALKKVKMHIRKLYAGMLGCSYDNLVHREKARKLRRIAALSTLGMLFAGCFIGMLFVKNRELSQKNNELTTAIELALNRESKLLVEQADEALQNRDIAAALKYASDALYSEDIERPYYAPAERVLFQAADVLHENAPAILLSKIALHHYAPIETLTYSADGSAVYTIDVYGTVSCFDSASGDLLWDVNLPEREFNRAAAPQILYDSKNSLVACYYDDILSGLDATTGNIAWRVELENTVACGFFFDEAEHKLAYIEELLTQPCEYNFVTVSTHDGSILHKILLPINTTSGSYNFAGAFAGSDMFAGTVFKTEEGSTKSLFYTVDLSKNAVTFAENTSAINASNHMRTFCVGNNRALVLGYQPHELFLQCFDLTTNTLLWESATNVEGSVSEYSDCYIVPNANCLILAVGNCMCVINSESGEFESSITRHSAIVKMLPLRNSMFSLVLANGQYAVGWNTNSGILYDSLLSSVSIDLPDVSEVFFHNGGIIQPHFTENVYDGLTSLPPQEGGGSITYLSKDRCTAYVTSALPAVALSESIPITAENSVPLKVGDFIDEHPQGNVLMIPSSFASESVFVIVDTENHTLKTIPSPDNMTRYDTIAHLSKDCRNILTCTKSGDIQRIDMNGNASVLSDRETITLQVADTETYVVSFTRSDAARLISSGQIVTARSDGKSLTFWLDGDNETSVLFPEDVCCLSTGTRSIYSMLHAGENGLILLADFLSENAEEVENFVVYDLHAQKWKLIPDVARGTDARLIVFAQNLPLFAVYDADMNIRLYDYDTAAPVQCIRTELPPRSIHSIGMLMDDQYMYVLSYDGQFMLYRTATGQMVFRTVLVSAVDTNIFSSWFDSENSRLYICVKDNAICIDVRSWEELFSVKDFKFYSSAQNEVYTYSYDAAISGNSLKAIPIPTTSELIHMSLDALH